MVQLRTIISHFHRRNVNYFSFLFIYLFIYCDRAKAIEPSLPLYQLNKIYNIEHNIKFTVKRNTIKLQTKLNKDELNINSNESIIIIIIITVIINTKNIQSNMIQLIQ